MRLRHVTVIGLFVFGFVCSALAETDSSGKAKEGREATPAVVNPAIRSKLRTTLSLDGQWDFAVDPQRSGEAEEWYLSEKALPSSRKITVPGCWEAQGVGEPALSNINNKWEGTESGGNMDKTGRLVYEMINLSMRSAYSGAAWYKKTVTVPQDWKGRQIWLKLGGVNSQGWIWVNGKYIAHNWAYCGTWKYNVTDLVRPGQEATIAVLVRNDVPSRRGEANCVRVFGGLNRSVELDATPVVSIDNAFVEPLFDQKIARVHVTIRNTTGAASSEPYTVQVNMATAADNRAAGEAVKTVSVGADSTTELTLDVKLDPFQSWSPESPFLYKADLVLKQGEKPIDGWVERFGMKKYEVRGGDLYLNNVRYFLRGYGDDSAYPITACSPASREDHAKRLRIAKQYGFNAVRHHSHSEIPEYYEMADELGIMVQPELPYSGATPRGLCHMSGAPFTPKEDLVELLTHLRRYTSLSTIAGGNERACPAPLDKELYQLAKKLDPSRLWVCRDGGVNNTQQNSDANHFFEHPSVFAHRRMKENVWPHALHEYMNVGINEDPRLEPKFTGAFVPNKSLKEVQSFVTDQVGLPWKWADACFDAGHYFQRIYQKIGIETARIDPYLDGFSYWLMVDLPPSSHPGVLDMFWEKKKSTPEYLRQFNSPTVVLAQTTDPKTPETLCLSPATLVYTGGDTLEVDWVVSHFEPKAIENGTLVWRLVVDDKPAANGEIEGINVAAGGVSVVGRSQITMPALTKAVKAKLVVGLSTAEASNSYDLWIFPKFEPQPDGGKGMAASAGAFDLLAPRYPGLVKLDSPEAKEAKVVVAANLKEPGVAEALEQGKSVVCLSLPGYKATRPGVMPGWWDPSNQTGTAIAVHPAFGDYPNDGYLNQGWFRLVGTAEKLDPGHKFGTVELLMVGIGRADPYKPGQTGRPLGFNMHAFQARVGEGKLLATGLNLVSSDPESVYLLDQFIRYAQSPQFQPKGTFDVGAAVGSK